MDLEEIYARSAGVRRVQAKFMRAGHAYWSVLTGENPVISTSTHQYTKFKSFLLYVGGFAPLLLRSYFVRRAVELTRSNRKIVIVPTVGLMLSLAIPAGVLSTYFAIEAWRGLRSLYFASYVATLTFLIDDPHHRIYKQSKIMRNAL